jgi:type VII secretion protein EccE
VARVSVNPPGQKPDGPPPVLVPRRRPGHLGVVHLMQLVLVEVALLGLVAVLNQSVIVLSVVGAAGLLVLIIAFARRHGRWWMEHRTLARGFKRRAANPRAASADIRLTALRSLAPKLVVEEVMVGDDSVVGVGRDDSGWFAAAELSPSAPMANLPAPGLPLDQLVKALNETGQPGVTLQAVTHTVSAPSLDLKAALPASYSYRELQQRFGTVPIPVDRLTWVAVRLDARVLAEAGVDDAGDAATVVAALLRKLSKTLRRAGLDARILDRNGLVAALERSCDLQRPDENAPAPTPREAWTSWHSTGLAHRTYWVRDWPSPAQATALVDWLAAAPATLSSVAFVIVPRDPATESVDLRCLVRVAAPSHLLNEVCAAVDRGAHVAHAKLFPLDGEQGPAVYATAPTGGGPR